MLNPGCNVKGPRARVKDRIQLRTPQGKIINTYIDALGMFDPPFVDGRFELQESMPVKLPTEISREDVPEGTEVWLAAEPRS